MTDRPKSPSGADAARRARLGAALRANLKRRKTQAKGRAPEPAGPAQDAPARAPAAPNSARFSGHKPEDKA